MSHDRAAVPAHRPTQIRIPDQVQQSKQPDKPRDRAAPDARDKPTGGVLHELRTDRAHD